MLEDEKKKAEALAHANPNSPSDKDGASARNAEQGFGVGGANKLQEAQKKPKE